MTLNSIVSDCDVSREHVDLVVRISADGEEGIGDLYVIDCSRLDDSTRERRKDLKVRSMMLTTVSNTAFPQSGQIHIHLIIRGMTPNTVL